MLALALGLLGTPEARTQAKPPAKSTAKAVAAAPKGKSVESKAAAPAAPTRRDPFDALVSKKGQRSDLPEKLPPGKAGLVVAGIHVDGLVRAPSGMIAVVSNQQKRVYFLREGDRLYNGEVLKITPDGVTFRESGKDAFGQSVDRTLTKRLYPSAGEQR